MQWTILGAGAIGSLFATHLLRTGQSVNLLDTRYAHPHDRPLHPMTLVLLDGSVCRYELPCIGYQDLSDIGCLLVTTKVWQVIPALEPLVGHLAETCPVILLHNGMGTSEWLLDHFPHNPLLAGTTSCGALKTDSSHIRHTGLGETWLGALNQTGEQCRELVPFLANALGHAAWSEHIGERQWRKLVVNAIINPLTAVWNQTNGALLDHVEEVAALCQELHPLLVKQGFSETPETWCRQVLQVADRTAQNFSSMHQDIVHHRKTEIDYITGYLLQQAEKQGLDLPENRELYFKVKELESGYTTE